MCDAVHSHIRKTLKVLTTVRRLQRQLLSSSSHLRPFTSSHVTASASGGSDGDAAQVAAARLKEPDLPAHASVVVIGGGVIGTSIAYHLAKQGCKDVLLLERDRLTSGTTWHAAGLIITFGSLSETTTEICKYTKDLYGSLEAETGQATGLAPVGLINIASDEHRLEEFRRIAAFNRLHGVDVREISASDVQQLAPLTRVDDVLAGFYVPTDGRVNPVDVTMALGKGARARGARLAEGCPVAGVEVVGGKAVGVRTQGGQYVKCDAYDAGSSTTGQDGFTPSILSVMR